MIRGMIRKPFFQRIQEALLLESLFPTVNLPRLLLNGSNGSTCQTTFWTGPEHEGSEDLNTHLCERERDIYIYTYIYIHIYIYR